MPQLSGFGASRRLLCVAAAIVAFTLSFGTAWRNSRNIDVAASQPHGDHIAFATIFAYPADGWQARLNGGEGQAYAQLADDPLMRRPEGFREGLAEASYRAQRPLVTYLTWLGSFGRRDVLAPMVFLVTSLSVGALIGVAAWWLSRRNVNPWFALYLWFVPGVQSLVVGGGADAFATMFVLLALIAYDRASATSGTLDRRHLLVVASLLALGALARETPLIAAAGLALYHWWRNGHGRRAIGPSVAIVALPGMAYALWALVVRVRFGAWFFDNKTGRLQIVRGLLDAADGWHGFDLAVALAGFAIGVTAVVVMGDGVARWTVAVFLAFSIGLGRFVWQSWYDFSRVLLPMWTLAVLALLQAVVRYGQTRAAGFVRPTTSEAMT